MSLMFILSRGLTKHVGSPQTQITHRVQTHLTWGEHTRAPHPRLPLMSLLCTHPHPYTHPPTRAPHEQPGSLTQQCFTLGREPGQSLPSQLGSNTLI